MFTLQRSKVAAGFLNPDFLSALAAHIPLTAFVETGTYLGDTAAAASTIFPLVHTIELSETLAQKARDRFVAAPHVHVHHGDSATLLAHVIAGLTGPALFWLDGHYSEGVTACGSQNTPIREELHTIAKGAPLHSVILIDDLRLFEDGTARPGMPASVQGYPALGEIYATLSAMDYQLYILGDVGLAVSKQTPFTVSPAIQALTISRLYDGENLEVQEVFDAEAVIMYAEGTERDVLREMPTPYAPTEEFGLGLHYRFWLALSLLGQGRLAEAEQELASVVQHGFNHWRLRWYFAQYFQATGEPATARTLLEELLTRAPDFAPARQMLQHLSLSPAVTPVASELRPHLPSGEGALEQ